MATPTTLPSISDQAENLIRIGAHLVAGISVTRLRRTARLLASQRDAAQRGAAQRPVLALHPDVAPASRLAPLLTRAGKPGFVVVDMADVDRFGAIGSVTAPDGPLYLVHAVDRGDDMRNWSPDEALPAIEAAGRSPLLLTEGIAWLLQQPDALAPNRCFMTIGSRLRRPDGRTDARTPAIWISSGTGRDGAANRHAPKIGWCWAGNRHTWLGFASCGGRTGPGSTTAVISATARDHGAAP